MRRFVVLMLAFTAACSQQEPQRTSEDLKTFEVEERASPQMEPMAPPPPPTVSTADMNAASRAGGPNISVTAAPGVAFNYRYAYRLPNARISAAQEAHASMCEKLGVARCRITGMRYSLVNERDVSAALELKLEPSIARNFGKEATKVITDAEGMLVDQQISGVDAGSAIQRANRGRAQLQDELERVNRELARAGLSNIVRDRLLSEATSLRSQIEALGAQRDADEESLASTPMAFFYGSGRTVPGFDEPEPLKDAFNRAGYNFLAALGFLLIAAATLLPWILLIALGVWLWRRFGRRVPWGDRGYGADVAPEAQVPQKSTKRRPPSSSETSAD